ncbi:MAG: UDP-N-acetylmuramoyl-L-alanyl-D-glutamate--2,6-diaminopimelate ligase [Clostridia bacterium]|nr:UDP-N-acetylmuramoyl-L-alanyl-D-glutamate--2,6-diaminopimelate ligase [Clostridia bacterium]MBR5447819.1 UDP-N-acetylmuramoyl-L-alanyl-D-glutamate--2,6-diaminopimelate ligase [Clostridia bacterium]
MKLSELMHGVAVKTWGCEPDLEVSQITSDSRQVLRGGMFICIRGTRCDGHDFIADAVSRGAAVIVAEREMPLCESVPFVTVENSRLAEAHVWNNMYARPAEGMQTVAVTGTNGKTSTVFMLKSIFERAGRKVGVITTVKCMADGETIGTFGGSSVSDIHGAMTTPDPEYLYGAIYLMKCRGVDTLIFEASSHALAQFKIDPIRVDVAVFTNLSEEHLDFHGDMENYFAAKARLATLAERLVVNADDAYMSRLIHAARDKVTTCSAKSSPSVRVSADVTALRQISLGMNGIEYIYFSRRAVFRLTSKIPGAFTVYNTLLASAAGIAAGVDAICVKEGVSSLEAVDGRLERVDTGTDTPFSVYIDYAHTPDALEKLLLTVRDVRGEGERICVLFGCGGDRDPYKRRKMGAVASRLADMVIVTADNSRSEDTSAIIRQIMTGVDREKPHAVIPDRREAIDFAVRTAQAGDIILLVGKGHEKYEITSDGVLPFDEKEIVKYSVQKYRTKTDFNK